MLYSIFRILVLGVIVLALGWGVSWLITSAGDAVIAFGGKEYRPSVVAIIITLIVVLATFWLLIELIRFGLALLSFVLGDKNAISKFFRRRRLKKGLQALTGTVLASANGDSKGAYAKAVKANKALDAPVLTGLLLAQAARADGKTKEAEAALKELLNYDEGRGAAVRGLMRQRLDMGDHKTARQLGAKAIAINPNDAETINTLFELHVEAKDWNAAREALKAKVKAEKLPADIARRREAVLAIAEAGEIDRESEAARYADRVMLAHRLAPNLVPAAALAADLKNKEGNRRAADTILIKAWNQEPHPDLASAFGALVQDETAEARLRRFSPLLRRQKEHDETRMLEAELLIAAERFPEARRAMGPLADEPVTARACAIMAAIVHGEGADDKVVRAYLARAAHASRGSQWVCENCGHVHAQWVPDCTECDHFDRLAWKVPPENVDQAAGLGLLLPILDRGAEGTDIVMVEDEGAQAEMLEGDAVSVDAENAVKPA